MTLPLERPNRQDPSPEGVRRPTLSGAELERLVGVSPERLRTWQRRFGFPEEVDLSTGNRRFYLDDVPRILAVRQLIAAGSPVAQAIQQLLAGPLPHPDLEHLARAFGALDAPVRAVGGPAPLELLWANAAARAGSEPDGAAALPDPSSALHRTLQQLITGARGGAALVEHPSWTAPDQTTRSLVWAVGAPAHTPSIAVLLELPPLEVEPDDLAAAPAVDDDLATAGDDRAWCAAVAAARRVLQREVGGAAIGGALAQLVGGTGAVDAFVLHELPTGFVCGRSARGRLGPSTTGIGQFHELTCASPDHPVWLTEAAGLHLTGRHRAACLAVPMVSTARRNGFVVVEFTARTTISDEIEQLLVALATAVSIAVGRDQAVARRRKAEQAVAEAERARDPGA